jgi:diguanylate cyclase (GGDEF)-like protein
MWLGTGLGLRAKDALSIILLTFLVVATTTAIHLSQLTRIIVQDVSSQTGLIAKQIYAQTRRSLSTAGRGNPREVLRRDRDLRSLLDASVGYSPYLVYALISDREGKVVLHTEREKEGSEASDRATLEHLLSLGPIRRFQALYATGTTYEGALPFNLDGKPFGTIRLGVAAGLLKRELIASVRQSLILIGLALPVAWLVAMGVAKRMVAEVRAMSLVDQLTGLSNRRGFRLLAEQQLRIANRTKRGILLLFADLDGMKRINDTLGHQEGDLALVEVAEVLRETFRESDIIARIGGDEFAIVAIEAEKDSADLLGRRLRENLAARNAKGVRRYALSMSLGVARYDPGSPCTLDELLARADRLMYGEKHGREPS